MKTPEIRGLKRNIWFEKIEALPDIRRGGGSKKVAQETKKIIREAIEAAGAHDKEATYFLLATCEIELRMGLDLSALTSKWLAGLLEGLREVLDEKDEKEGA